MLGHTVEHAYKYVLWTSNLTITIETFFKLSLQFKEKNLFLDYRFPYSSARLNTLPILIK
jgi:hypothetical protein